MACRHDVSYPDTCVICQGEAAAREVERARLNEAATRLSYLVSSRAYRASLPIANLRQAVELVGAAIASLEIPK